MRQCHILIYALLLVTITASSLYSDCGLMVELRHINGIWTNRETAIKNATELKSRFGTSLGSASIVYAYSYNDANGIWELFFQKDIESDAAKSRALASALLNGTRTGVDQATLDRIQAEYLDAFNNQTLAGTVLETASRITSEVTAAVNNGHKVVLVPHSQGGLYANEVFKAVTGGTALSNKIKIVGVGETANSVAGDNSSYVTASEDRAINLLRVVASALPANVTAGTSLATDWFTSHGFQTVYLNPSYAAWPAIKNKLTTAIGRFQPDGKALFTVTWDNPSYKGVDLRLLENGKDIQALSGVPDPRINIGSGAGTVCIDLPLSPYPATYVPIVYNRGAVTQTVSLQGPLGSNGFNLDGSGILSTFALGQAIKVQNGLVSAYP